MKDKIVHSIIYGDRALVTRKTVLTADKGGNNAVFKAIPANMIKESVRIKSNDDIFIEDIEITEEFQNKFTKEDLNKLYEEIENLKIRDTEINKNAELNNYLKEFINNLKISAPELKEKGDSGKIKAAEMQNLFELYSKFINGLNSEQLKLFKNHEEIKNKIDKIQKDIAQAGSGSSLNVINCCINFFSSEKREIELYLSYLIYGSGWNPVYDARLNYAKRKLELSYLANVYQNTGENWEDINLSFSTAMPHIGAYLPELQPWYVDFYYPSAPAAMRSKKSRAENAVAEELESEKKDSFASGMGQAKAASIADEVMSTESLGEEYIEQAEVKSAGLNVTFDAKTKYSINSDGTLKKVILLMDEFPVKLQYIIIPRLSENAYLKAFILNDKDYPLLSGQVKVFYDNNYIGDSNINFVSSQEEFELFLGIDKSIDVKYQLINKYMQKSGITSHLNKITYKYKITITSYKEKEEEINLFEQVPVSADKEIKIKLEELDIFSQPDEKGVLNAIFKIKPKEKKEINLIYSVEFPKDKYINLY